MKNNFTFKLLASSCYVFSAMAVMLCMAAIMSIFGGYGYISLMLTVVISLIFAEVFISQSIKGKRWQRKLMFGCMVITLLHLIDFSGAMFMIFCFNLFLCIVALFLSDRIRNMANSINQEK